MAWSEYIAELKDEWVGALVIFEGETYKVVDVDYNGGLLIDKPAEFTDTTSVPVNMVRKTCSYEDMLDTAHAFAARLTDEELLDFFEHVIKRDLTRPLNLAMYGAFRGELLGRLKGV